MNLRPKMTKQSILWGFTFRGKVYGFYFHKNPEMPCFTLSVHFGS